MPNLFAYGSLQDGDVQRLAFGRLLPGQPDQVVGFERSLVPIDDPQIAERIGRTHYANLIPTGPGDERVSGTVFEITDAELVAADAFERLAGYVRVSARLASGAEAWLYVHEAPRHAAACVSFTANNELALHLPDPAAAEAWYTGVLGCEVFARSPDCVSLRSGALRLYLLRDPERAHDAVVLSFDVPDRAAALAWLQAAGCTPVPIGPHAPGEAYLRDPHGIVFDVVERRAPRAAGAAQEYVEALWSAVEDATPALLALSDAESARHPAPGRWSPREILGHLVDSASNNHQRFVRARWQDNLVFEGYDQDEWVAAQQYQQAPWAELVGLWRAFNLHLARVMAATPESVRTRTHTWHNLDRIAFQPVAAGEPTTLDFFMADYVAHLLHHLRQVLGPVWRVPESRA
jgi:gamma-glutamylcyclotransferase (GGCT)/AIG2-like uncharacterized protein YtfP